MIQRYDPDAWMDQLLDEDSVFAQPVARNRLSKNQLLHLLAHRRQPRLLNPHHPFSKTKLSNTAEWIRGLHLSPPAPAGKRTLPSWMAWSLRPRPSGGGSNGGWRDSQG